MLACQFCQKGVHKVAFSRHKKGSSGAGGTWALRAPITKRLQKPNLHIYMGMKLCTKCLKTMKKNLSAARLPAGQGRQDIQPEKVNETPVQAPAVS